MRNKSFGVAWWAITAILVYYSYSGGDASIVAGWLYIIWTLPFGFVWHFLLYDMLVPYVPSAVLDIGGSIAIASLAFWFWFIFFPKLRSTSAKKSP
jgi:hypothetical protein